MTKKKQQQSKKKKKSKSKSRQQRQRTNASTDDNKKESAVSWVDRLKFESVHGDFNDDHDIPPKKNDDTEDEEDDDEIISSLTVISWNVLAEAYCSRRSHRNLPKPYQKVVFDQIQRKNRILAILQQLTTDSENTNVDVVCLQEVDLVDEIRATMETAGFVQILETPRVAGGGSGGRTDACAIYVSNSQSWKMVDHELVRLDDLATLGSRPSSNTTTTSDTNNTDDTDEKVETQNSNNNCNTTITNVQGMQASFLRRNMALIVRLQHQRTGQTVVLSNAHLFWNPGFEYVKLCQAHYILLRIQQFIQKNHHNATNNNNNNNEPVVFCGDLNSRPHGVAHSYLSRGYINAKLVAPWYAALHDPYDPNQETIVSDDNDDVDDDAVSDKNEKDKGEPGSRNESSSSDSNDDEVKLSGALDQRLTIEDDDDDDSKVPPPAADTVSETVSTDDDETTPSQPPPRMRYLLDASLNKFCRWLRILGQDTALETDEQEKLRTGGNGGCDIVIFDQCRDENRTLVTTSPKLMIRRDCPASAYCIHPPYLSKLEVALVHMLLTHGVVLEPSTFLTRCVVCNGNIVQVYDAQEKVRILKEYEAPPHLIETGMAVFECDGCGQGYWWNDRPTSSASRVKVTATRLFELCLRAGVPVRTNNNNNTENGNKQQQENMFQHVNVEQLRQLGWDKSLPGSELLEQRLDVIDWLKNMHLECPFQLESAYAHKKRNNNNSNDNNNNKSSVVVTGETLPFTNVTFDFVSVLDYIFFDKTQLCLAERLYVPTSFPELADGRLSMNNAHLLPSDVWPSDHLAIGARLAFRGNNNNKNASAESSSSEAVKAPDTRDAASMMQEKVENGKNTATSSTQPFLYCAPVDPTKQQPPPHGLQCACGCVPAIPSLFEMAALRKKKQQQQLQE